MWIWRLITRQSPAATSTPKQRSRHLQCLATRRRPSVELLWMQTKGGSTNISPNTLQQHATVAASTLQSSKMKWKCWKEEKLSKDTLLNVAPVISFIVFILYLHHPSSISPRFSRSQIIFLQSLHPRLHLSNSSSLPKSLCPRQGVHVFTNKSILPLSEAPQAPTQSI